jgi:tetratricopeptide (TPR) repeat protein
MIVLINFSFAQDVGTLFKQGNDFYKAKNYKEAINSYQKIIDSGEKSPVVYYNLGNSFYRSGMIGYAILYYEKALKLAPGDEDIIHNIKIASARTTDKVDVVPKLFLFVWWDSIVALFNINTWSILAYIFFLLLLDSILLFFFSRSALLNRISFFGGIFVAAALLLSIIFLYSRINVEYSFKYAVVVETSSNVKSSPDENSLNSFVVHEGLRLRIDDNIDNWYKIRLEDGKIGWIEKKAVGVI